MSSNVVLEISEQFKTAFVKLDRSLDIFHPRLLIGVGKYRLKISLYYSTDMQDSIAYLFRKNMSKRQ